MEEYEFECGHQECRSRLTAFDKDYLMALVAEHLRHAHNIAKPTETIMTYLEATCVTRSSGKPVR